MSASGLWRLAAVAMTVSAWTCLGCVATRAALPRYEQPRPALVVLDLQLDFVGPQARMPVTADAVPGLLTATNAVIAQAARRGWALVYVGNEFGPDQWIEKLVPA
ncbi:hypothetical protein D3C72_465140 [compost metagenome]